MSRNTFSLLFVTWLCRVSLPGMCAPADAPRAAQLEFFETRIRPVLVERCYSCHNTATLAQGGLAVDQRASLRKGGSRGAVIVPGKPENSRLIAILEHNVPGLEMPKGGAKMDESVIAYFAKWIAIGAPDPHDKPPAAVASTETSSWTAKLAARKKWWCFQPIKTIVPPSVAGNHCYGHPIDRFVFADHYSPRPRPERHPHLTIHATASPAPCESTCSQAGIAV